MTTRKKTTTGKTKNKKLGLKRETITDLDVRNKDKQIKGGYTAATRCWNTCKCAVL